MRLPPFGMMISGRMTPARICVAPEIDAFWPAWAEKKREGFASHRNGAEPFGENQGKAHLFRARDGHAEIVAEECAQILVVNARRPPDPQPRSLLRGPASSAERNEPPTTTLPFMSGVRWRGVKRFVRRGHRHHDLAARFTADAEDTLHQTASRFDHDALLRMHLDNASRRRSPTTPALAAVPATAPAP